jgi:hypothetical protein
VPLTATKPAPYPVTVFLAELAAGCSFNEKLELP